MIITLKNLQQQSFTVDIDPSCTVKRLKEEIEKLKGRDYPVDSQKLIYSGKILENDSSIEECSIDEKKFVVVMVCKPKVASENIKPTTSTSSSIAGGNDDSKPAENAEIKSESKSETCGTTKSSAAEAVLLSESAVVTTDSYKDMVNDIVETALRASFNNPDRAVEYLINGIPSITDSDLSESEAQIAPSDEDPLSLLREQPQFQQMRTLVQQNPDFLNTLLQQIGETNPALLAVISQNQEAFVRMLNEPSNTDIGTRRTSGSTLGSGGGNLSSASEESPVSGASGTRAIQITSQDKEAIEELKQLGYPEELVVQAYFACEKNVDSAANFLLSQNLDE